MPDSIHSNTRRFLFQGKYAQAIEYLEAGLRAIKRTTYHKIINKTMLGQMREAANYLTSLKDQMSEKIPLKALYVEMNGFSDNTDCWYFEGFGYKKYVKGWDHEWLAHWDIHSDLAFKIDGWEDMQATFAEHFCNTELPLQVQLARDIAEHLVLARYCELITAASKQARHRLKRMSRLPLFAGAHELGTEIDVYLPVPSRRRSANHCG